MPITPGAGYQIDPTNSNSVVPIAPATSPTPAAQAPATPTPVSTTPAAPGATTAPATPPPTPGTPPATPAPTTPAPTQPGQQPLTYNPAVNPSVVDLLNSTGQDSSMASRQKLATQYGIQGYTGTAQQNTDLATKYTAAYNALKGTAAPQSGAAASTALDSHLTDNPPTTNADAEKKMFDALGSMNPVIKNLYDQISHSISAASTQQSYEQEYAKAINDVSNPAGIPGESLSQDQMKLLNIKNIMSGTEGDIRNEISNAGGFATESQVAALTTARNKTLLNQATYLQQSESLKQDYVDHLMQFSQQDRTQAEKNVNDQLGLTEKLTTLQTNMNNAAQQNYQKIVDQVGYSGLAQGLDANGKTLAEKALGLSKGALSDPKFLAEKKPNTTQPTASIQEYEYAKSQGYKGSFSQYQNEDANRKAKAVGAANGLSSGLLSKVVSISDQLKTEPDVIDYNVVKNAADAVQNAGTSPADDLERMYSFLQTLNPKSSMVRQASIDTVKSSLLSTMQGYGLAANRVFTPTGALTEDARLQINAVIQNKLKTYGDKVNQVASQYSNRINKITGSNDGTSYLTDYTGGLNQPKSQPQTGGQIAIQDQKTHEIRYFPAGTNVSTLDPKLYQVLGKTK